MNILTRHGWMVRRDPEQSSATYHKVVNNQLLRAWYDPTSRQWIIYPVDPTTGHQCSACSYAPNINCVDAEAEARYS